MTATVTYKDVHYPTWGWLDFGRPASFSWVPGTSAYTTRTDNRRPGTDLQTGMSLRRAMHLWLNAAGHTD